MLDSVCTGILSPDSTDFGINFSFFFNLTSKTILDPIGSALDSLFCSILVLVVVKEIHSKMSESNRSLRTSSESPERDPTLRNLVPKYGVPRSRYFLAPIHRIPRRGNFLSTRAVIYPDNYLRFEPYRIPASQPNRHLGEQLLTTSRRISVMKLPDTRVSHLPNEILLKVFAHLDKQGLKSVRLVCKNFADLASESLFENVKISPSKRDMELFTSITQNESFARCVRTFTYDVSQFIETKDRYGTHNLYVNSWTRYFRQLHLRRPEFAAPFSTKELEKAYNSTQYDDVQRISALFHDIIEQGYSQYLEHGLDRVHNIRSGEFFDCLCSGLKKLPNLKTVAFDHEWNDYPAELTNFWVLSSLQISTPKVSLARGWNPYYLKPAHPEEDYFAAAFLATLNALHSAKKTVEEIRFAPSLMVTTSMLDSRNGDFNLVHKYSVSTMQNLRKLSISILSIYSTRRVIIPRDPSWFEPFLLGAPNLKHLSLLIDEVRGFRPDYVSFTHLFPNKGYPSLITLQLEGMKASRRELTEFFQAQPDLRHLVFKDVDIEGNLENRVSSAASNASPAQDRQSVVEMLDELGISSKDLLHSECATEIALGRT